MEAVAMAPLKLGPRMGIIPMVEIVVVTAKLAVLMAVTPTVINGINRRDHGWLVVVG
jgi:hypothetical protein